MTNVRDLGGYETQTGFYTKSHKFIRSTNPSKLSDDEKEYLYYYLTVINSIIIIILIQFIILQTAELLTLLQDHRQFFDTI